MISICTAVLAAAAVNTGGAGEKSPAEATISDLTWLAGYWMSNKRGTLAEECWLPPEGSVMLGLHRDASDDGDTFFEYLRIMQTAEGIYYYATPQGYDTTKFKLTALSEDGSSHQVVFENPEHDFPKLIRYTLRVDGLMAEVEGIEDDRKIVEVWVWQRAEFPATRNPTR
jgi:hypothetical protein